MQTYARTAVEQRNWISKQSLRQIPEDTRNWSEIDDYPYIWTERNCGETKSYASGIRVFIDAIQSRSFWTEAINTANYIRNRCPSNSLDGLIVFEVWTGSVPDVSHFREFGAIHFTQQGEVWITFQERNFGGLLRWTQAYRIWLPHDRRIDIVRDVRFPKNRNTFDEEVLRDLIRTNLTLYKIERSRNSCEIDGK